LELSEAFKDAYVGITSSKRLKGIRLNPYIEVRGEKPTLQELQLVLLQMSIGCTIRKNFLRIQGIQNCKIISPFTEHQWFREAILLFEKGEHLTKKGREKILELVPRSEKTRIKRHRIEYSQT